jgi:Protein of unknown function (DUF3592)
MDLSRTQALGTLLVGVSALTTSAIWLISIRKFKKSAARAKGRVTEKVYSLGNGDMGATYAPRFEFKTPEGESRSVLSATGSMPAGFRVGDEVRVLYDPSNPNDAKIDSVMQLWFMPMLLGIVGIVALGVWLIWLVGTMLA